MAAGLTLRHDHGSQFISEDRYVGLAVDAVIKPLSEVLGGVKFIAGTTVRGDGGVSVILDVPNLVGFAQERARRRREAEGENH